MINKALYTADAAYRLGRHFLFLPKLNVVEKTLNKRIVKNLPEQKSSVKQVRRISSDNEKDFIQAIKEQQKMINELQKENEQFKSEIEELSSLERDIKFLKKQLSEIKNALFAEEVQEKRNEKSE